MNTSLSSILFLAAPVISGKLCKSNAFGFKCFSCEQVASLGNGNDHVLDAISHCEQIHQEMEGVEGGAPWRLFLRKEMFCPWESAVLDPVATGLVFAQVEITFDIQVVTLERNSFRIQGAKSLLKETAVDPFFFGGILLFFKKLVFYLINSGCARLNVR